MVLCLTKSFRFHPLCKSMKWSISVLQMIWWFFIRRYAFCGAFEEGFWTIFEGYKTCSCSWIITNLHHLACMLRWKIWSFTELGLVWGPFLLDTLVCHSPQQSGLGYIVRRRWKKCKLGSTLLPTDNYSYAAKVHIINSLLLSMLTYWSFMFVLPQKTIKLIKKHCRRFLWGDGERKFFSLVAWSSVCKPKKQGGLNIVLYNLKCSCNG